MSGASSATAISSNSMVVSVAVSKSLMATSPETTSVTEFCNPSCAARTISKAISDSGSRFGSEATVFTAATDLAIAAITSAVMTANGATSATTLTKTACKVSVDVKSMPASETAVVEICFATAWAS